jgi:hypothetical protein
MFLLVFFAVIVNAEIHVGKVTKQCENKIALTTQNLKAPLTKLQVPHSANYFANVTVVLFRV